MQSSQAGKTKLPLHALLFAAGGLTALGLVGGANAAETAIESTQASQTNSKDQIEEIIVAGLWTFATAREPRVFGVRAGYKF
jgi:hypothetical protein